MAPPAGLLLPGGLQYFVDVLGAKSRYDIVLAYMGLMVVVTAACGLASRLLSGLCVRSYRSLSAIDKWDWDTRIGSSIHAALSTALALYVIGGSGVVPGLGGPLKGPACLFTSPLTWAAIGLSLGYFIADTFALAYYYPLARFFRARARAPATLCSTGADVGGGGGRPSACLPACLPAATTAPSLTPPPATLPPRSCRTPTCC